MNNPNPLIPQGSLLEQKNRNRARVRVAFLFIASVHIVGLMALLTMQGCKREQPPTEPVTDTNAVAQTFEPTTPPAPGTNVTAYVPPVPEPVPPTPAPVATGSEYTIVKGDSFYSIGKHFGVSIKAIQEANPGVDSIKLKVGQKIMVPAAATRTIGAAAPAETGEQVYTVKSGDNLTKIANAHGVKVKDIRSANNLQTDSIKVGQKLKIPVKAPAAVPAPAPAPTTAPAGR
jgi:LysM repeat protein